MAKEETKTEDKKTEEVREGKTKVSEEILKEKKTESVKKDNEKSGPVVYDKDSEKKPAKKVQEDLKSPEPQKSKISKGKKERAGILNIYTSFNNTLMNLTDLGGKSLAKYSGGQSTKQSRLKANPTIAMFVSQKIAEEARDNGITGFYVKIRAATGQNNPGPGAHAALKSLTRAGFKILSIMDTTRIPRGGPKKKGGRRGRRP